MRVSRQSRRDYIGGNVSPVVYTVKIKFTFQVELRVREQREQYHLTPRMTCTNLGGYCQFRFDGPRFRRGLGVRDIDQPQVW
jgi:hypothetical protein